MSTFILPTKEQFDQVMTMDYKGPIFMINLLKFKPDGGAKMYQQYIEAGTATFKKVGLKAAFQANIAMTVIGGEAWDEIIIAEYPSIAAFIEMNRDKDYQQAVQHRTDALLDSRLYLVKADEALVDTIELSAR
jgi:uncharacterized protein (DUF1330 family)